jgi:hypothetical protein
MGLGKNRCLAAVEIATSVLVIALPATIYGAVYRHEGTIVPIFLLATIELVSVGVLGNRCRSDRQPRPPRRKSHLLGLPPWLQVCLAAILAAFACASTLATPPPIPTLLLPEEVPPAEESECQESTWPDQVYMGTKGSKDARTWAGNLTVPEVQSMLSPLELDVMRLILNQNGDLGPTCWALLFNLTRMIITPPCDRHCRPQDVCLSTCTAAKGMSPKMFDLLKRN